MQCMGPTDPRGLQSHQACRPTGPKHSALRYFSALNRHTGKACSVLKFLKICVKRRPLFIHLVQYRPTLRNAKYASTRTTHSRSRIIISHNNNAETHTYSNAINNRKLSRESSQWRGPQHAFCMRHKIKVTQLSSVYHYHYYQKVNIKKVAHTTFVDISAMRGDFCVIFYTTVKQSDILFITTFS